MRNLVILGAGTHGQLIYDVCLDAEISVAGFLDDNVECGSRILDSKVIGGFAMLEDPTFRAECRFITGIGGSQDARRRWSERVLELGGILETVIHPSSVVSRFAKIGMGTFIKQNVTVFHNSVVGNFAVIDCNSCIGHDNILGDNVFIAPATQLNGSTVVEDDAYIGSGVISVPYVTIGRRSVVGANSTVTGNIPAETVAVGSPATVVKQGTGDLMAHIDNAGSIRKLKAFRGL